MLCYKSSSSLLVFVILAIVSIKSFAVSVSPPGTYTFDGTVALDFPGYVSHFCNMTMRIDVGMNGSVVVTDGEFYGSQDCSIGYEFGGALGQQLPFWGAYDPTGTQINIVDFYYHYYAVACAGSITIEYRNGINTGSNDPSVLRFDEQYLGSGACRINGVLTIDIMNSTNHDIYVTP